jgi:bifunctional non-homologous end joining protein LigD
LRRWRGTRCHQAAHASARAAFDLLWLDREDLRALSLTERKTRLQKLRPRHPRALVYVQHVTTGTDLFKVVCALDMEGIVAKQASASYTPNATTWVKIKNKHYSQAVGSHDFYDRRKARTG